MPMRILTDVDEARRTILARRPAEQEELSPGMRAGIRRVFGANLGAAQVVERILDDVRREGDAALLRAIPARVAGVEEIVVATPPGRDGAVPASTLAAARVAGVHRIVKAGGAQAIAALAYGTARVPRVDKIFGPGNIFVALAKQRVAGVVAIDQVAGPTETLIIADEGADPE